MLVSGCPPCHQSVHEKHHHCLKNPILKLFFVSVPLHLPFLVSTIGSQHVEQHGFEWEVKER